MKYDNFLQTLKIVHFLGIIHLKYQKKCLVSKNVKYDLYSF